MFYFPAEMAFCHVLMCYRSLAFWVAAGQEWWTTPIVVPTGKRIWCIWRLGFWWSSIRYEQIRKAVFSQWRNCPPRFTLVFGEDRAVVLEVFYSFRDLDNIKTAVLHNWRAATGKRLRRQEVGRESVIWTLEADGETDAGGGMDPAEAGDAGRVSGKPEAPEAPDGDAVDRKTGLPEKAVPGKAKWLFPLGALTFGAVSLFLMVGMDVFVFCKTHWPGEWTFWLALYGYSVARIRFFKVTSGSVTVFSCLGLWRTTIRLESLCGVEGRWEDEGVVPTVWAHRPDGPAIRLNKGRRKLCERLIAELRMRLAPGGAREPAPPAALPDLVPPSHVLLAEWLWDYALGLFLLFLHVLLVWRFR